jgi:hypothetical protein
MSRLSHPLPITGDRLRRRLVTPENKRWWTLAAVSLGLFMINWNKVYDRRSSLPVVRTLYGRRQP